MTRRGLFIGLGTLIALMSLGHCAHKGGVKVTVEGLRIRFFGKVHFESGKAALKPKSHALLNAIAQTIRDRPVIKKIRVEGHTCDRGGRGLNLKLSQRRAEAVRAYLVKAGISPDRLTAAGYGERRPVASNRTPKGRKKNRRVEFVILKRAE